MLPDPKERLLICPRCHAPNTLRIISTSSDPQFLGEKCSNCAISLLTDTEKLEWAKELERHDDI